MMLCSERRLWQGVMALALGLASAPWLQAQTIIRNVSGKTWLLKLSTQGPRTSLLDEGHLRYTETVVTVVRSDRHSEKLRRSGKQSAKIRKDEAITLYTPERSFNGIEEVFTLQDADGLEGFCSIVLKGPGSGRARSLYGPSLLVFTEECKDLGKVMQMQSKGIVLAGRAELHIRIGSYAEWLGHKPADPVLSPVAEGALETSPAPAMEVKADSAPAFRLPPLAPREEKQQPSPAKPTGLPGAFAGAEPAQPRPS